MGWGMQIHNLKNGQMQEYNEIIGEELLGHRRKKFVRCDSDVFSHFLNEIRTNSNCSYDTYINDLVKEGYTPKYLSTLIKRTEERRPEIVRELFCGRIVNFFELPVTYDTLIEIDSKPHVASLDFIRPGEEFMEMGEVIEAYLGVDEDASALDDIYYNFESSNSGLIGLVGTIRDSLDNWEGGVRDFPDYEKMLNDCIENYVYCYLVRAHFLCDTDFYIANYGLLINWEEKTFRPAPNYDLELASFDLLDENQMERDLRFVRDFYPHIAEKFYEKLRALRHGENSGIATYSKIFDDVVGRDEYCLFKEYMLKTFRGNLKLTEEVCERIFAERQKHSLFDDDDEYYDE